MLKIDILSVYFKLAWGQGFEPRLMASEATVLPLDDPQSLVKFYQK